MLKPYAHDFGYSLWQLLDLQWNIAAKFEKFSPSQQQAALPELANKSSGFLARMRRECEELGLHHAVSKIDRTLEELRNPNHIRGLAFLKFAFHEIRERMQDELSTRKFYFVPPELVSFYEQAEPFGSDITVKFPDAKLDIAEAAKCLALGRHTASVFHLMRALEIGVQALGQKLGVQQVHEKPWGNLTTEMDNALKARYPRNATAEQKAEQARYAEILSHLNGVRIAWRNTTMHPKASYTQGEAREIFDHARTFLRSLASVM